jgi:hypothetical protein
MLFIITFRCKNVPREVFDPANYLDSAKMKDAELNIEGKLK